MGNNEKQTTVHSAIQTQGLRKSYHTSYKDVYCLGLFCFLFVFMGFLLHSVYVQI
jgi:hypothetical protein